MKKVSQVVVMLIVLVTVMLLISSCAQETNDQSQTTIINLQDSNTTPDCDPEAGETVLYDSGRGDGQYDQMTYWHYYSLLSFTPTEDITVNAAQPDIWYCNGDCYYQIVIYGEDNDAQTMGNWSITADELFLPDSIDRQVTLENSVLLESNKKYYIYEEAWTTKSVGIYTSGNNHPNQSGAGDFTLIFAESDGGVSMWDRGAIGFKLIEAACP